MFIDFVTLMLLNMAAGLAILACYVYWGLDDTDQGRWVPALGITGLVALLNGFRMSWTWPLPGAFNTAYGDLSVLFGALFLGAAISLWRGWNLIPLGIYALVAGLASILTGVRFIDLRMSGAVGLTAAGFILTGLGGVFALPTLALWRKKRSVRLIGAAVLIAAAAIWAFSGYLGYWIHLQYFAGWKPVGMK
ncbi:MAG: DUF981 domain-containing protein [Armatimonadetes bacterium]|nr:DUF981 domain-containing protein [Armatimonadota bacterium]